MHFRNAYFSLDFWSSGPNLSKGPFRPKMEAGKEPLHLRQQAVESGEIEIRESESEVFGSRGPPSAEKVWEEHLSRQPIA